MNNFDLKNLNVVFAGCARDCEPFLKKTLDNIELYSSLLVHQKVHHQKFIMVHQFINPADEPVVHHDAY